MIDSVTNTSVPTSRDIADAMIAFRNGKMTTDEYRALMRRGREHYGDDEWERIKFGGMAIDVNRFPR